MEEVSFEELAGLEKPKVVKKESQGEVSFEELAGLESSTPPPLPPQVEKPKTYSRGGTEEFKIPGMFGATGYTVPYNKPEPPRPILKGFWESTIGGLDDIINSATEMWKKGDLPGLVNLSSNLLSGGVIGVDPSKGITEGGLTSETGRNIIESGKELVKGKPYNALMNLVEAVPYIGPMVEAMNQKFEEGKWEEGIGFGVGTAALFKGGAAIHSKVRSEIAARAAERAAREYKVVAEDPAKAQTVEELATIQESNKTKLVEIIDKVATEELVKEDIKVKSKRVRKYKATPNPELMKPKAPSESLLQTEIPEVMKVEEVPKAEPKPVEKPSLIEPITEIDLQTGTPTPPALQPEVHPLRQPGTDVYKGNKSVATDIADALNELPDKPIRDPGTTTWSLVNDVNKWLDGDEGVDIARTRDFLSELAIRADEFKYRFAKGEDYPQSFLDWKESVEEAAEFARRAERPKNVGSVGEPAIVEPVGTSELIVTNKDISAIEEYYGRSIDEIPDGEIEAFMKGERPKVERPKVNELVEEDFTPEELAEFEKPEKVEKKKPRKPLFSPEKQAELDKIIKGEKPSETGRTPEQEAELAKLISEQSEDAATERLAKRRRVRTSLNFGLPLDEAGRIMKDWYSQLREYAVEKLGNRASGQQIKATLRKGSTADEWKAVQLDELLEDGKVYTKEEVLKKIDEGTVEFKDVVLEGQTKKYYEGVNDYAEVDNTKFSTYQEPGGSNYREAFVTAPRKSIVPSEVFQGTNGEWFYKDAYFGYETREKAVRSAELYDKEIKSIWRDGHSDYSDIENPIVRLRMNDRVDGQGNKILFLEEMQPPNPDNQAKMPESLRKRWREIGMKRALKYAIDGEYDKLAWTTGEMQANRYSLAREYKEISVKVDPEDTGLYEISGLPKQFLHEGRVLGIYETGELDRVVGPELAEKIRKGEGEVEIVEGDTYHTFRGLDLNLGGEGLRKLYDQDLPNVAKKLGGKVEETEIDFGKIRPSSESTRSLYYRALNALERVDNLGYDSGKEAINDLLKDPNWRSSIDAPLDVVRDIAEYIDAKKIRNAVPSISLSPLRAKATKGFSLYSGIPLDKLADEAVKLAKSVSEYTRKAHEMKEINLRKTAKAIREEFNKAIVDRSGNIRTELLAKLGDTGYDILQKMYLSKGASSRATSELRQMRKEVYGGLSSVEKKILDDLILDVRMIDISKYKTEKQFKFPKPIEAFQLHEKFFGKKVVNELSDLTPEQVAKLRTRAKAYYDWMKKPLKEMLDEGLISESEYNDLIAHNYRRIGSVESPTMLADLLDKKYEVKIGDTKRTIYDSGIEKLARGQASDIYEPSSEIMALETFNRAYGRIMNNQANRALLDLARSDPNNPYVRFKQEVINEQTGEITKTKIPSGFIRHFVYEGGERKSVWLSPELSKEWITLSKDASPRLAQVLRYASMSPVTRLFATGIEWSFAMANLPRDIMHSWFAARYFDNGKWKNVYSAHSPVFAVQLGHDLASVFGDALLRKGRWIDYIKEGGGMDFLVHQARPFQKGLHLEGPMEKAYNLLGYLNETSEVLTRLAIRERMLRRGRNPREATFAARDYMDFSQGGWLSKTADNFFPYLNASIQGTRGLIRSFKPGSGTALANTYRLVQFGSVVVGLYLAAKYMAPKSHEAFKNDVNSQNNVIIPLGDQFGFVDDKGQTRYPCIKIPLDPSQKFFKKFFEASTDKWLGEEVDVNGTVDTLKNLSPAGINSLPATVSAAIGYLYNYDLWREKEITKKTFPYPESREEFSEKTPTAARQIGELTGFSPDRVNFVAKELIADSMWGDIVGGAYEKVFGDLPKEKKEQHLAEALSKVPGIKRFIGISNPYSKFATKSEEIEQEQVLTKFIEDRNFDLQVSGYLDSKTVSYKEMQDFINSHKDRDTRDRMRDELKFAEKSRELPNRSFWMRMKGMPNLRARAELYLYRKSKETSPEEKAALLNEERMVKKIGGILTEEFDVAVAHLNFEIKSRSNKK